MTQSVECAALFVNGIKNPEEDAKDIARLIEKCTGIATRSIYSNHNFLSGVAAYTREPESPAVIELKQALREYNTSLMAN